MGTKVFVYFTISSCFSLRSSTDDLVDFSVAIDRRMVDYCFGLDTEFGNLVEGSLLYTPTISIDKVILPPKLKDTVLNTVENFDEVQKVLSQFDMDEVVNYGKGLCILFHGMSGTGKTMFANAIAAHLSKKILLANFSTLAESQTKTTDTVKLVIFHFSIDTFSSSFSILPEFSK